MPATAEDEDREGRPKEETPEDAHVFPKAEDAVKTEDTCKDRASYDGEGLHILCLS